MNWRQILHPRKVGTLALYRKALLASVIIVMAAPVAGFAGLELPVEGGVITSGIGWRVDPFGSGKSVFHRGVDIAVPVGTPVRAVRKGRVFFAGAHGAHGSTVIIQHDSGDMTLYGHNSSVKVRRGQTVEQGTVVAFSGNTGRSTGPHVHFEELPNGRPILQTGEPVLAKQTPQAASDAQKKALEQRMEESVDSILSLIRQSPVTMQGG